MWLTGWSHSTGHRTRPFHLPNSRIAVFVRLIFAFATASNSVSSLLVSRRSVSPWTNTEIVYESTDFETGFTYSNTFKVFLQLQHERLNI